MTTKLEIVYIVPSRYDDDGYVQRWIKGVVPSNSLSVVRGLTLAMAEKGPFPGVGINVSIYDDNVQRVPVEKIARLERDGKTKVVVGLVGVQSNQFPRAVDIALKFRRHGIAVMIGGFHVTGVINLFPTLPDDMLAVMKEGIALVCGEIETPGGLEELFRDVLDDKMQTVYRFPVGPDIEDIPLPSVEPAYVEHFGARWATIDSSRGCPYGCTFCTVINIQGRKMRCRSSRIVLDTIRKNHEKGVGNFFFTDDNFARNRNWEEILDGMIAMRENEGIQCGFMMQIDTQAYKIPRFLDKATRAGCRSVFIGMESVTPASIAAAGKTQNHVEQYRPMVALWQQAGIMVHVGYIIGFPTDTYESVKADVHFLRDHVNVDLVSFFMLTPLPGSMDHKNMLEAGIAIDPDYNKYDSFHETSAHPGMPDGRWMEATLMAYNEFYTKDNIVKILRRVRREHYWMIFWNLIWYRYSGALSGTHPMMTGFFRQKDRFDRRPGFPRENIFKFAWRWLTDFVLDSSTYIRLFFEFQEIWFLTRNPAVEKVAEALADDKILELLPETEHGQGEVRSRLPSQVSLSRRRLLGLRHWAPLASLKRQWESIQQRWAEYNWSGQCDKAISEIRELLQSTASMLRERARRSAQCRNPKEKREARREAKKLNEVVKEIETYLQAIDHVPADPTLLYRSQLFIRDRLIERYEALSCRYVGMRRSVNAWRLEAYQRLNRGRLVSSAFSVTRKSWLVFVDAYLSLRFTVAALRKEL